MKNNVLNIHLTIGMVAALLLKGSAALAAPVPVYEIIIRDHLFEPSQLTVPAGVKIKLVIHNQDASAEEFESFELNREKVIMGNRKGIIFIGPLIPGRYPFFGEFNPKSAQGEIIAE